jgi:amino acid adenylation domain-containing protein
VLDGGPTTLPRWTREPSDGVAHLTVPVPEALTTTLDRLGVQLGFSWSTLLLGAHVAVLAALTGERDVTCGYVPAVGGKVLPCRSGRLSGSWRAVLTRLEGVRAGAARHRGYPIDALRTELGSTGPDFETVVDDSPGAVLPAPPVLRLGMAENGTALRLTYRLDALDAEAAERIAGYHLTALRLMVDDPDGDHAARTLISTEELRHQLDGLAGPVRELPDRRFHELFERRVAAHPDAPAIVHGDQTWTYRELNRRANHIGRALLARGLRPEDVVAVVTERNLDWAAAVIGILKAGGVYLPVEPHFPADRIATILTRAGCRFALTEPGSCGNLDPGSTGTCRLLIAGLYAEGHPDDDLGVEVRPDQLAYIYFTSGSTGEPKGAMCEHAGMLNHLYAKVLDLRLGELPEDGTEPAPAPDVVVAQTAPQCFDISLWQLVAPLLVGGRTFLVDQEVMLDVGGFVGRLERGRVSVLQVVPSYLDALAGYLAHEPAELPALGCVAVTGEALSAGLARRWFAVRPGRLLVNAYGLTETSDDTNHEVMDRAPDGDRVPLGPPVPNVRVYVVDERLNPVPLGAPGEIVYSGVCVARGYVNDPDRTRAAFVPDPHRPGERLYRGGDYGRWLPGGKLEFLGRRDDQVKISGLRVEVGEVESTLLAIPGVRDAAVVVVGGAERRLVAFYTGSARPESEIREALGAALPAYMVPSDLIRRTELPLTPNGKTDRAALVAAVLDAGSIAGGRA